MFVDLVATQRAVQADISSLEISLTGGAASTPTLHENMRLVLNHQNVKVQ